MPSSRIVIAVAGGVATFCLQSYVGGPLAALIILVVVCVAIVLWESHDAH